MASYISQAGSLYTLMDSAELSSGGRVSYCHSMLQFSLWSVQLSFEKWREYTKMKVLLYLRSNWQEAERCHVCHWTVKPKRSQRCPACDSLNALSLVCFPLHNCNTCNWVGNPDHAQTCTWCEQSGCLTLLIRKKLYENQLEPDYYQ